MVTILARLTVPNVAAANDLPRCTSVQEINQPEIVMVFLLFIPGGCHGVQLRHASHVDLLLLLVLVNGRHVRPEHAAKH